jgi:hypothetical protein
MRGGVGRSQSVALKETETERFLATLGMTAFGPVEIRERHLN